MELLRELREGQFEALVGVNLLREGLDLPEVSLVAILDADKEGFLRSETSLIQTIGRAARNVNAKVILYADRVTDSMQQAIDETRRRRELQEAVQRRARHHARDDQEGHPRRHRSRGRRAREGERRRRPQRRRHVHHQEYIDELEAEMLAAAEALEFERAAAIRDRITQLNDQVGEEAQRRGNPFLRARPQARPPHQRQGQIPRPKKSQATQRKVPVITWTTGTRL